MGTFADLYCIGKTEIHNKEEFTKKGEKVFQHGGITWDGLIIYSMNLTM